MKWISVKDSLPESKDKDGDQKWVMAWLRPKKGGHGYYTEACINEDGDWCEEDRTWGVFKVHDSFEVTHWFEIEPPI